MPMNQSARHGLLAAGNFITDFVKLIEAWPRQDTLASIVSESMSGGGGPYNVLMDLAALEATFPLEAAGLLGDDPNGRWIRQDCAKHGIDTTQLRTTPDAATSYTDVMCVRSDGRRTFFH
ncbi:MAG: carbohydrate kinase family protein, partial [Pirellulales bacterium]|nr:carbohydrate kinase family protein [Pirellulales bacterium]